ncbi:MAG: HD domain-containing protein [Desulfobacteraceae bacterium]|nr:HD domain-containing protein [Desulfobacteraceae bacterium]
MTCDTLADTVPAARAGNPDIVVVDIESVDVGSAVSMLSSLREAGVNSIAAVFGLLGLDPGAEQRCELLGAGVDDLLITPPSVTELRLKAGKYLDHRELEQRFAWKTDKLDNAMALLKKFKTELGKTRRAYSREKSLLHNSLKQINMMTRDRDRLKAEVQDLGDRFQKNTRGIETILASMIESRNESNKGHSRRVAGIAVAAGDRLGLKDAEKKLLSTAALLHDVGRLFIPDSILGKAEEELTEYDRDRFRKAPAAGADFLKECPGLERAAGIIAHLNENSDGSGWPKGLKRRYIPLMSRILAGAKILDDLATTDPRPAVDKIPEMLEEFSGTRLDPRVVNALEHYVVTCMNGASIVVKEVGLHQLEPGMVIGAGVYTNTGTKLFSAGAVLTPESITMLMRYNKEYPLAETVFIKAE